jgi:hypothetical protein
MATLELNGKSLATQTSTAEPVLASTVTGGAGLSGSTSLGTVTVGNLSHANIVYPAGTVKYIDRIILLNASQPETDSTTLIPTGLELLIPSATVALYSKIYFNFFHAIRWQSGTSATNRFIDMNLLCDGGTQDGDVLFNLSNYGFQAADMTSIRGDIGGTAVHTTLGTGDRTYKFQVRKGGGTDSYSGTIYYQGASNHYSTMIAFGVV